jgi:hypothetical protein
MSVLKSIKNGSRRNIFGRNKFKNSHTRSKKKSKKSNKIKQIKRTIRKKNKLIGSGFLDSFNSKKKKYTIKFGEDYNENNDEDITELYMIGDNIDENNPHLTLPDGKYYGDIEDNKRNGQGVMKYRDGDEYTGHWKDDKRNGMGIMKWTYIGDNSNHGNPIPIIYVGEFKDDNFNGHGKLKYNNGFTYIGEWKNGMKNGYGLAYDKKQHFIGDWNNDIFLNGIIYNRIGGWMGDPNQYYIDADKVINGEFIKSPFDFNTNRVLNKTHMDYYL